jgi:YggT family protein
MDALLATIFEVTELILSLYVKVIFVGVILSWLVAFGVINMHNRIVQSISDVIYRLTEPLLRPIRRMLPPMGNLDLSPFVLMVAIYALQILIRNLAIEYAVGANH